ncbi:MAG: class I SAM-dependent methyltransferase [Pyrinomonadaceae bacterium]|nr:class I SAM-dependent methyltransferase [Pyrinomonadaceae bacterium]
MKIMKKHLIAWIVIKLALLGIFWIFAFSNWHGVQLAQISPTPTPEVSSDKIDRPTSNPYKGDLSRYDKEGRAEKLQIQRVMDLLRISEGKMVADIGAGGGWFSVIAAERIGEKGKVYAVDINEDAITYINDRKIRENVPNIEAVLGDFDDPKLPKKSIDAVLILNTYHEIEEPIVFMKNLLPALKKDALVGIIDRDGTGGNHGIDEATLINEAKRAGFTLKERFDFVNASNMDYFLIFKEA